MNKSSLLKIAATGVALMAVAAACDDDDKGMASNEAQSAVRVIHTSYDAPAVDVAVDGSVAISDLAYGEPSGYASLPSGTRAVAVTPAGATSPVVISANLTLDPNTSYTVYAVDELSSIEPIVSVDDRAPVANQAKVRFVHASPDAPAVDIRLNSGSGPVVFGNQAFKGITDYAQVAGGSYTFVVTPAGATAEVVKFDPVTVTNGTVYTVVAHGTLNAEDAYPFAVRVFVDNGAGSAFVDLTVQD